MNHKAMAIPVFDTGQEVKFLVVHDKRHREWTFVTGGCKSHEVYNPIKCAVRELEEETRGTVNLRSGKYNYFRFNAHFDPIETSIYHVYVFHVPMNPEKLDELVTRFNVEKEKMDTNKVAFRKNYDENDSMKFLNLREIRECPTLWRFVLENVIQNKDFYKALDVENVRNFTLHHT
jgi:ADP-ribose pyrophosphatase YjhB (NUDIX family)